MSAACGGISAGSPHALVAWHSLIARDRSCGREVVAHSPGGGPHTVQPNLLAYRASELARRACGNGKRTRSTWHGTAQRADGARGDRGSLDDVRHCPGRARAANERTPPGRRSSVDLLTSGTLGRFATSRGSRLSTNGCERPFC